MNKPFNIIKLYRDLDMWKQKHHQQKISIHHRKSSTIIQKNFGKHQKPSKNHQTNHQKSSTNQQLIMKNF